VLIGLEAYTYLRIKSFSFFFSCRRQLLHATLLLWLSDDDDGTSSRYSRPPPGPHPAHPLCWPTQPRSRQETTSRG